MLSIQLFCQSEDCLQIDCFVSFHNFLLFMELLCFIPLLDLSRTTLPEWAAQVAQIFAVSFCALPIPHRSHQGYPDLAGSRSARNSSIY
jgi:hypothetical protein